MTTSFNLFTILVIWLCIDGLNGDASCEVCSDSNDPSCSKVELKQCSSEENYCLDAYFKPSSDDKSSNGILIKQCGSFCPALNGTPPDVCHYCLNTQQDKCNQNKTIDLYVKLWEQHRLQEEQGHVQQAQTAADVAIQTVEQIQRDVAPDTAFLAAMQQALSHSEGTAKAFGALAANQQQMAQQAEQQLAKVHARLEAALVVLHATEEYARRAAQAAKAARYNAAASAQLAAVSTAALVGGVEENHVHH